MMSSKPSPRDRFKLKLDLIQSWLAIEAPPADVPLLKSVTAFREWEDEKYAVLRWTSFSTDAPGGENSDLRAILDGVLRQFADLQRRQIDHKAHPKSDVVRMKREIEALTTQIVTLDIGFAADREEMVRELEARESRISELEDVISELSEEVSSLKKKFANITKLRSV